MMKDIQSKYTLINFQLLLVEIDIAAEIVKLYMMDDNLLSICSYAKNTSNLVVLIYQALKTFVEQKSQSNLFLDCVVKLLHLNDITIKKIIGLD